MPRDSLDTLVEARLDDSEGGRFLDLCVDCMRCECPKCARPDRRSELYYTAGGRWDRVAKRYVGEAATSRRFEFQDAQHDAVRWFASWLRARRAGQHVL